MSKILIYIDAEFQGYMVPKEGDPLLKQGFQSTEPYLYTSRNVVTRKYHFLLSLGIITVRRSGGTELALATFPSLYKRGDGFDNVQILEPGYTTAAPATATRLAADKAAIVAAATAGTDSLNFAFINDLNPAQQEVVAAGHAAYNKGRTLTEGSRSKRAFEGFLKFIEDNVGRCVIIHKGNNDLVALKNTCIAMGVGLPPYESIDLDHYNRFYQNVPNKRLNTLQQFWAQQPALAKMRDSMLEDVVAYIVARWGEDARDSVAAHNPLVDCVYAAVVLEGLRQYEPTAAELAQVLATASAASAASAAPAPAVTASATVAAAGGGRMRYKQVRY
jgi:hypothetical protein